MERDPAPAHRGRAHRLLRGRLRPGLPLRAGRDGPRPGAHRRRAQRGLRRRLRRPNILGHRLLVDIVLHWGAGAYIVGEETALIESLEGNRGMPRLKPPFFPAAKGLYLQPTIVNNVETLSNLPWIVSQRRRAPSRPSAPRRRRGTRLFAVSGHVNEPGRLRGRVRRHHLPRPDLRPRCTAAASATATQLKAFIPGGASAPVVLRGAPRPAAREGHRRQGRLDARLRAPSS